MSICRSQGCRGKGLSHTMSRPASPSSQRPVSDRNIPPLQKRRRRRLLHAVSVICLQKRVRQARIRVHTSSARPNDGHRLDWRSGCSSGGHLALPCESCAAVTYPESDSKSIPESTAGLAVDLCGCEAARPIQLGLAVERTCGCETVRPLLTSNQDRILPDLLQWPYLTIINQSTRNTEVLL